MTGLQEIQDSILGLEAELHGKRLELAMGQGERDTARQHLQAMKQSIQTRRDFRIAVSEVQGGCFFDAAGQADRIAMGGVCK